jgi:flagellin-like hook-associated protein FlgL
VAGVGGATAQGAALVISTQDSTTAVGVQGYGTGANTVGGGTINWSDNNYQDSLAKVITQLEAYDNALKMQSGALANNLMTITTREEFSTNMINTIEEGADELTLADLNEEGANLLSLQSTNQLATQSLSLSSQQSQTVVQLMG